MKSPWEVIKKPLVTEKSMAKQQKSTYTFIVAPETTKPEVKNAVEKAAEHLRELRVAEVVEHDIVITDGKVEAYRTKLKVSFKYEG